MQWLESREAGWTGLDDGAGVMMRGTARHARSAWLVAAGAALALVGAGLTAAGLTYETASFGWFAYAPLSDSTFVPPDTLLRPVEIFGYGVAMVGVVVLAWALGHHRSPQAPRPFLPGTSRRVRAALAGVAGAAVLAALAGVALLVSAPPALPGVSAGLVPGQEMSVAYASDLSIAWDAAYGPTLAPGLLVMPAGLVLSAVVLGWRAGQPGHPRDRAVD